MLAYAIQVLEKRNLRYMVVGSFASIAYGEPRFTLDIDIVVALPAAQVASLCNAFPSDEFYVSHEAAEAAVRSSGQFNVIEPVSGNKIDFIIARDDAWGREQLNRRQRVELLANRAGFAASPEDIIIAKMLYYQEGGSEKHLRDITGILKVSGDKVDRDYVLRWAKTFGLDEIWSAILRRIGSTRS
jgi:hypothetical protein